MICTRQNRLAALSHRDSRFNSTMSKRDMSLTTRESRTDASWESCVLSRRYLSISNSSDILIQTLALIRKCFIYDRFWQSFH